MRSLKRLGVRLVILVGCGLGLLELAVVVTSLNVPQAYGKDFGQEYLLARVLLDRGIDPYQPLDEVAEHYLGGDPGFFDKTIPTPHPLTAGLLLLPLGLLSYADALRVWFLVQLVSIVGTVFAAARVAGFRIRPATLAAITLLLCAWEPLIQDLGLGQLTLPMVCLLALAEWSWLRQQPTGAGVLLGLGLLLKPLAWAWLLVMARRRSWRALAGTGATVVVGYALVALRLGIAPIVDYFTRVLPQISAGYALERTNTSVWAIGPQLFQASSLPATVVSSALAAVLLGLVWWSADGKRSLWFGLSLATAVSTVINPVSWFYNLVLVLPPGAHVLACLEATRWPRRATWIAIAVGILLSIPMSTWLALGSVNRMLGFGPTAAVGALIGLLIALARALESKKASAARGGPCA
jgi:Glycosyltransferase family 87